MSNEEYKKLVKNIIPEEDKVKKYIISFIIGGLMGILAEFLIELFIDIFSVSFNDASSLMLSLIIFLSCLFTSLGFFDDWVKWAGAGLFIPISGFAHSMCSSALDYKKEGLVFGIGSNIFKLSGSVILYGVVSAYIFGLIRYILFGG